MVVTGSQKALMLPPGLAFVSVSPKARKKIESVKQPNLYLSLPDYLKSFETNDVPWTPAITLVRGLHTALKMIEAGATRLGTSGSVAIIHQWDQYEKGGK